jgi:hypothetical protein
MTSDAALDSDLCLRAPSCSPRKALRISSCAIEVSSSSRGVVLIEASTMMHLFLGLSLDRGMAMSRAAGLSSVCAGLLDRLEKARFVRRERDTEDRRKVIVKVLPGGAQKVEKIMAPLSEDMNKALQAFTEEELKAVVRFFEVTEGAVARHVERIQEQREIAGR